MMYFLWRRDSHGGEVVIYDDISVGYAVIGPLVPQHIDEFSMVLGGGGSRLAHIMFAAIALASRRRVAE